MKKVGRYLLVFCLFAISLCAATWTSSLLSQQAANAECVDGQEGDICSGGDGGVSGGSCADENTVGLWADTCHGGGWRKYEVTGDTIEIKGNSDGSITGGYVRGCSSIGATHYYRLALSFFRWPQGTEENQVGLLPVNKFVGFGGVTALTSCTNASDSDPAPGRPCMTTAQTLFETAKAKAGFVADSMTFTNISWFCWNDKWLNTYESNSIAYSAYDSQSVSSDWVDGATSNPLSINAKAGDTVEIHFKQLIRATYATQNSTDWQITRFSKENHTGVTFEDITYGGKGSSFGDITLGQSTGTLTTTDTNEHALPAQSTGSGVHKIKVSLPENDTSKYTISFCEQIDYQSASTYKADNPKDKWSYVCVTINVTPKEQSTYESNSKVYNPYNGQSVASNWVNGATDSQLVINAKAGDKVDVHFGQLIRATSATKNSTDWQISRFSTATHSGVTFEDTTYGGKGSSFGDITLAQRTGTLSTSDTDPHPLPSSSPENHQVRVTLPASDTSNYSISFCEQIKYKSTSSASSMDRWSYVCVTINVTSNSTVTISETCPLPSSIYTPPAAGTIHHGDTESGSGVQLTGQTWVTSLYAKPTDSITFAHCVNPEAQAVKKTKEITEGHGQPCSDVDDDHDEWVLNSNSFRIDTENYKVLNRSETGLVMLPNSITFSSSSSFSVGGSGYSVTFTGTPHKTDKAVVYSSASGNYNIKMGSAGGFIKQSVTTDVSYADENRTAVDSWVASACSCCLICPCLCSNQYGYWPCCCHCPCSPQTHTHWYFPGKSAADYSPSSAWVYVPYNFKTSGSTNIYQGHTDRANEQVVLPDTSYTLTAKIRIDPRSNATTNATYATEPPSDTKVQIVTFYLPEGSAIPSGSSSAATEDVCTYYNSRGAKNCNFEKKFSNRDAWMGYNYPDYGSGKEYTWTLNLNVQNVPAGYLLCSSIGISHTDSKNDTNDNAAGTVNSNWNIIGPTCRSVAKNPNSQVWGGSLLTNGRIQTSSTTKPSVSNRTFGSWVEFATIAGGNSSSIQGLGSGASLGYITSYGNKGGNTNSLFYVRTPLAIANNYCISNPSCTNVSASGITSNSTIMSRLITRFIDKASSVSYTSSSSINLSSVSTRDGYRITRASGDITISNYYNLPDSTTQIVYSPGDITISSNLTYDKTNSGRYYSELSQIPQYVIIAGGNINIEPQVQEIDAWLIAEYGIIDTCVGKEIGSTVKSLNSSPGPTGCGSQLVINGPVIAKSILPKRAYGAGAQDSSGTSAVSGLTFTDQYNVTAAETFNLSIYSYLWAFAQAYRTTEPHTVYTRVLAPRL